MVDYSAINRVISDIARNKERNLTILKELVSQPTVSAQGIGIREGAALVAKVLEDAGIRAEIYETAGNPVVFGQRSVNPDKPTILFYGHYDVQPPEPMELWLSDPFKPEVRDGRIWGRGVADNKGQFLAHVLAVRAYTESRTELPVNVKFLLEGEEECSSPFLATFAQENLPLLKADVAITSDGPMHPSGRPTMALGVRGIMTAQLRAKGAKKDYHSGNYGGVVPNPAWKLIHLLADLRDETGHVNLPGFYDEVVPPTEKDKELLRALPFDREALLGEMGIEEFDGDPNIPYFEKIMFRPTFNICGFKSGYAGQGAKTIIPSEAIVKFDTRLVVNQDPEKIFAAFKEYITKKDQNIEVSFLGSMKPSKTPSDSPAIPIVMEALKEAYNEEPVLLPTFGGSLPDYVFTKIMKIPSLIIPYANADENNHAPNENLVLELYHKGIKASAHIIWGLQDLR
jgi:acetylornithine deacetylase/succinyl-diaminopimelate desuccinylase-like protein